MQSAVAFNVAVADRTWKWGAEQLSFTNVQSGPEPPGVKYGDCRFLTYKHRYSHTQKSQPCDNYEGLKTVHALDHFVRFYATFHQFLKGVVNPREPAIQACHIPHGKSGRSTFLYKARHAGKTMKTYRAAILEQIALWPPASGGIAFVPATSTSESEATQNVAGHSGSLGS